MRLFFSLCTLGVLASCRKDATPPPDAGVVKQAIIEFPVPTASSTLSVFEPAGASCEWRQVEPVSGTTTVLAKFPGNCVGARVSWSPDASKALVWFDPTHVQHAGYSTQVSSKPGSEGESVDETAKPRAFFVSTRKPQVEPVKLPSEPKLTLDELGVDGRGTAIALMIENLPEDAKGTIESGGERFDLSTITEGLPALAQAWRYDGAKWVRFETKLTTTSWDYALGVQALDAFKTMGPRSVDLSASHAQGDSAEGPVLESLAKLAPKNAGADDGAWIFLGAGGARLYVWEVSGEFAHTTGLLANVDGQPLPKLGFTDGDLVAIRTSGAHVLVTASDVGTHPRVYEYPSAKLIFSSDTARAVTFWPTTAKAAEHHD